MNRKNCTTEKLFHRLLNNKSSRIQWDYLVELRSRGTKEVFVKSYELAHSDNLREKIIGIDLLAQLGSEPRPFLKESLSLYFELLDKETNYSVIRAILHAIGHNNDDLTSVQIAILTGFKRNKSSEIRRGLVSALLHVDNEEAINTLIFLTNDKVTTIRDWATFGIGTQSERDNVHIRTALWKRVEDQDETTRFEAIVGLAKRKDPKIKAIIERELLKDEFGKLLFEAIEELNDKDFIPLLQKSLETNINDQEINPTWLNALQDCLDILEK
jgi:HEAT repeat protein